MSLHIITSDSDDVREVMPDGVRYTKEAKEGCAWISLDLHHTNSATSEIAIHLGMEDARLPTGERARKIEMPDCVSHSDLPRVALDTDLLLRQRSFFEENSVLDRMISLWAAPFSKLRIVRDGDSIRFELSIGERFHTEATVPLEELAAFFEPA